MEGSSHAQGPGQVPQEESRGLIARGEGRASRRVRRWQRFFLLAEQGPKCAICTQNPWTEVHHINFTRSDDRPENLVGLCHSCHVSVSMRKVILDKAGLLRVLGKEPVGLGGRGRENEQVGPPRVGFYAPVGESSVETALSEVMGVIYETWLYDQIDLHGGRVKLGHAIYAGANYLKNHPACRGHGSSNTVRRYLKELSYPSDPDAPFIVTLVPGEGMVVMRRASKSEALNQRTHLGEANRA